MDHEIEVPAAFSADCDNCFLVCDEQDRADRRPICIARHEGYIAGYKAAMQVREKKREENCLTTKITVLHHRDQKEKAFMFAGLFDINKGTKFVLDTESGRYGQTEGVRTLADATVQQQLSQCVLRKLEIRIADTLIEGNGGTIKMVGLDDVPPNEQKKQDSNDSLFLQERAKLADKLLLWCPQNALEDCELIADLVRRGESLEEILSLDAVSRWPAMIKLLKSVLAR